MWRAALLALSLTLAQPLAAQGLSQGFDGEGNELQDGDDRPIDGLLPVPGADAAPVENLVEAPRARLRALDTMTNTVNDFYIGAGETLAVKRLIVTLEACLYPAQDPGSEAYAFLKIRDRREEEDRFSGWMLASSPAFSALDHPRYDIWVLSCSAE